MTIMMKVALFINRLAFMLPSAGTPKTASQPIVDAAMGEFDGSGPGVTVVDQGNEVDIVLCGDVEQNARLYEALLERTLVD